VIQIEKVKLYLFADGMILYLKDPKDSQQKTLTSDKHFQQSTFSYTNSEHDEKQIRNQTHSQ
jgi:hypothetical protein